MLGVDEDRDDAELRSPAERKRVKGNVPGDHQSGLQAGNQSHILTSHPREESVYMYMGVSWPVRSLNMAAGIVFMWIWMKGKTEFQVC